MKTKRHHLIIIFLLMFGLSPDIAFGWGSGPLSPPPNPPPNPPPVLESNQSCVPTELPYKGKWAGGDVGISTRLPDGRIFWIFGDSFISNQINPVNRVGATFIMSSTVGISQCVNGQFDIGYYNRYLYQPTTVFAHPTEPQMKLWPAETFVHNGELFIIFWKVLYTPGVGMGFDLRGVTVARIANTSGTNPLYWSVTYRDLITNEAGANAAYPASTAVVQGEYVYLYAHLGGPDYTTNPMIITRSPIATFGSAQQSLQYYSQANTWESGLNISNAKILIQNGASKYTVRYHPTQGKWLATYMLPFFSNKLLMRTADNIEGPWSAEIETYTIPELTPGSPSYKAEAFCYGGEEHFEYHTDSTMLVSYTCNIFNNESLLNDMSLYKPVLVTVPINFP